MLVNNAGILRFAEVERMEVEEYLLMFSINQLGCFLGMKSVARTMRKNGGGSIVNASSIEGLGGMALCTAYSATKFAIRGMTKAAAMELGPKGIRVNSVHPGMIDTAMTRIHGGDAAMEFGATQGRPQARRPPGRHRPGRTSTWPATSPASSPAPSSPSTAEPPPRTPSAGEGLSVSAGSGGRRWRGARRPRRRSGGR